MKNQSKVMSLILSCMKKYEIVQTYLYLNGDFPCDVTYKTSKGKWKKKKPFSNISKIRL